MTFVKKAYDIARKKVFFCDAELPLMDVAHKMHSNNIGSIIVKKNDVVEGIITVNDLLRQMSKCSDPSKVKAHEIMSSPVVMANKDIEIDELVELFHSYKVSRLVLVDKTNKVVGVVRDIAVYKCMSVHKYDKEAKRLFAQDYMRPLY